MKDKIIEKKIDDYCNVKLVTKTILVSIKLLIAAVGIINTFFYNYLINNVFVTKQLNKVAVAFIGMIFMYFMGILLSTYFNRKYNRFMFEIKEKFRTNILKFLFETDENNIDDKSTGEIKNVVDDDIDNLEKYYNLRFLEFRIIIITLIIYFVLMLRYSLYLTILCCALLPISYFSIKKSGLNIEKGGQTFRREYGKYENYVLESIKNWREIKSNNLIEYSINTFLTKWKKMSEIIIKNDIIAYFSSLIVSFDRLVLIQSVVYAAGGFLIIKDKISIEGLLIFVNYYALFLDMITKVSNTIPEIKKIKISVEKIMHYVEKDNKRAVVEITESDIEFRNVSFSYPKSNRPILQNVSFFIPEKSFAVLFGKSGCGKSTILKLLSGELRDYQGGIFIGGYDIKNLSRESVANKICIVMQDNYFFNYSVKENLLIAKMDATDEEIYEACRKANILDVVNQLSDKMDTVLGENASILSGGQKQRLAIARAILRNTDIILFDEVTSALDFYNERIVTNVITELSNNHTVVCVTHKKSIKEKATEQVIIENGRTIV